MKICGILGFVFELCFGKELGSSGCSVAWNVLSPPLVVGITDTVFLIKIARSVHQSQSLGYSNSVCVWLMSVTISGHWIRSDKTHCLLSLSPSLRYSQSSQLSNNLSSPAWPSAKIVALRHFSESQDTTHPTYSLCIREKWIQRPSEGDWRQRIREKEQEGEKVLCNVLFLGLQKKNLPHSCVNMMLEACERAECVWYLPSLFDW